MAHEHTGYHAPMSEPARLELPRRRTSFLPFAAAIVFSLLVALVVHLVRLHFHS